MRRVRAAVPFVVLLLALPGSSSAQRKEPAVGVPQQGGAEGVFARQASKVVFLVTRRSGALRAIASGVILTADGYVGTNYHALQGADAVEIRFFPEAGQSEDYQSFNAVKLLYSDPERDIAILKVNSNSLPFLACPTMSGKARVGEKVYAIGNPKGLSHTISEGIVSALRSIENEDIIQHTAAISHGSSGGALVDANGGLLGMNSWQVADGQNLNFAIPSKYLSEALSAARHATIPLSFPPDNPDESGKAMEDRQEQRAQVAGTTEGSSQPPVAALLTIARTIRECPETVEFERKWGKGSLEIYRLVFGPPKNVVWDVAPSKAVRSPYTGYIEFSVSHHAWVPPETRDKYEREYPGLLTRTMFMPDLEFKYEFDVGPEGLELTKALVRPTDAIDWGASPKRDVCWDNAARQVHALASPGIQPRPLI